MSGGQRQRLAIARAVVKAAPVLVLDEATCALDPDTEARVLRALKAACVDTTVLLIAHRYSTVSFADRVLMLDAGRIVGHGTQADLLGDSATFRRFVDSQRGDASAIIRPMAGRAT